MPLTVKNMRDFTGYLQLSIVKINNLLNTIDNPKTSSADKLAAKQEIKKSVYKIAKMMQTVAEKEGYTITVNKYTDEELTSMKLV